MKFPTLILLVDVVSVVVLGHDASELRALTRIPLTLPIASMLTERVLASLTATHRPRRVVVLGDGSLSLVPTLADLRAEYGFDLVTLPDLDELGLARRAFRATARASPTEQPRPLSLIRESLRYEPRP